VIRGHSGTGKEVLARAVHELSGRRGRFVAVNCGGLVESLVQSELFGYRRGAFSGATEDRPGVIRTANAGTLFLDEIGDMPSSSQAVLLRVLQEREVKPLGATEPIAVDIRVMSATHCDLEGLIAAGDFRADLYARLSGFEFRLPPLGERREDIGLLTARLLERAVPGVQLELSPDAARALFLQLRQQRSLQARRACRRPISSGAHASRKRWRRTTATWRRRRASCARTASRSTAGSSASISI